jgi:hypothetical protein
MSASDSLFCFTSNTIDYHPCSNCHYPMLVRINSASVDLSVRTFECFNCDNLVTIPVPVGIHTRRMVETSLEAVALCGASLLSDAFAPVPSPSERGFLNSSPQAEPSVQISCTGLPR